MSYTVTIYRIYYVYTHSFRLRKLEWNLMCMQYKYGTELVGSSTLQVTFAKEPYKRDYILQKRPVILYMAQNYTNDAQTWYGVATISRLLKNIVLFCRI